MFWHYFPVALLLHLANIGAHCLLNDPQYYNILGNVAYQKQASQSGMFSNCVASNAVDGKIIRTISVPPSRTCIISHPWTGGPDAQGYRTPAWWKVDLGQIHAIEMVQVINRAPFPSDADWAVNVIRSKLT